MQFTYIDEINNYESILDMNIKDCLCKHVLRLNSDKSTKLLLESQQIGYDGAMWGFICGLDKDLEHNRLCQIFMIQQMIYKKVNNAIRIIVDKDNNIWIDNLHTAIKHILLLGEDVKIKDINVYILDMRNDMNPIIVDINNSIKNNLDDIKGTIEMGYKRLKRVNNSIVDIHYTIGEFLKENDIDENAFSIDLNNYR